MPLDFARLGVPTNLVTVLAQRDITIPTPIQAATLPDSLAGRDVLGRGRTGSGKTYAFLLPLVARLTAKPKRAAARRPRALVLAPTRELATQIAESLEPLASATGLTTRTVFGGVGQNPQVRALERGVDVLIACPGRLLDLMDQGHVILDAIEITVIDEADHMADMGFLPMVRRVLDKTPGQGQRMLFSATLDAGVDVLVKRFLHSPVVHEADSSAPVGEMEHHLLGVSAAERGDVLAELAAAPGRTILFTRTKHGAKKLTKQLIGRGIPAVELHGNLNQNARTRNLDAFHHGLVETLVATDIAARGIHVDDVALVVHADPPAEHKAYLHRSGRTARAGQSGTVITLVTPDQRHEVAALMRAAKIKPTTTAVNPGDATLASLAPGERTYLPAAEAMALANPNAQPADQRQQPAERRGSAGGRSSGRRGDSGGRSTARQGDSGRNRSERTRPEAKQGAGSGQGTARRNGSRPASSGANGGAAAFSASSGRGRRR
ncbi:MAG TPA: DEAD/DEAH box helicase [Propionicimonas sp.]|nr:DEAD/DEAH box helicase [Propionicimonas sp.]HQA76923.1 DEAD/DEAH box helicase [Propionicimonas sp.]HQD97046.1 DEAD/DEAH box helicase [Propionicimonas sp.]